jgi:hypothetical protein
MKMRLFVVVMALALSQMACALLAGRQNTAPTPIPPSEVMEASPMPEKTEAPTEAPAATPTMEAMATEAPQATEASQATAASDDPKPSAKLPPLELPEAQPGPDTLDLTNPDIYKNPLRDYTDSLTDDVASTGSDDQPLTISTVFSVRRQAEPPAWSSVSSMFDDTTRVETISTEGSLFIVQPDGTCTTADNRDPSAGPSTGLAGLFQGQAKKVEADVEVNGMPADRYEITAENLKKDGELKIVEDTSDGESTSSSSLTVKMSGTGSLYLAQQGGFVLKVELSDKGTATEKEFFFKPGSPMERSTVIEIVPTSPDEGDITIPKDCGGEGSDAPSGDATEAPAFDLSSLPKPDDAQVIVEDESQSMFTTSQSVTDVAAFYTEQLTADGWEAGEKVNLAGMATLNFTKDGTTITITILTSGANTMVTIMIS